MLRYCVSISIATQSFVYTSHCFAELEMLNHGMFISCNTIIFVHYVLYTMQMCRHFDMTADGPPNTRLPIKHVSVGRPAVPVLMKLSQRV